VIREDNVSYGGVKRYVYRVVVREGTTEKQLARIVRWLVLQAKAKHRFNALGVFFYRSAEEIDGPFTVASADFAPGGVWADADQVRTGEYETMQCVLEMR